MTTLKTTPLLEIKDLTLAFHVNKKQYNPVKELSLSIAENKTICLIGESGSGKSLTALSILRLLPAGCKIKSGSIFYKDKNILALEEKELRKIRGKKISMIFQDPHSSLNPLFTVKNQLLEVFDSDKTIEAVEKTRRILDLLKLTGFKEPEKILRSYPHELSGGMIQRVMISMALLSSPDLLIADEPTTSLDVTIQAQILQLLKELQKKFKMSILLITHDLGVMAEVCDFVNVIFDGRIVEKAPAAALITSPKHPYTKTLFDLIPEKKRFLNKSLRIENIRKPVLQNGESCPDQCIYYHRCYKAQEYCKMNRPLLKNVSEEREVACFFPE